MPLFALTYRIESRALLHVWAADAGDALRIGDNVVGETAECTSDDLDAVATRDDEQGDITNDEVRLVANTPAEAMVAQVLGDLGLGKPVEGKPTTVGALFADVFGISMGDWTTDGRDRSGLEACRLDSEVGRRCERLLNACGNLDALTAQDHGDSVIDYGSIVSLMDLWYFG